jgi:hypothetical protein
MPAGNSAALELTLSRCPLCAKEGLSERPMFVKEGGKLSYEGGAHRTVWTSPGVSISHELARLQPLAPATATPPAASSI